MEHILATGTGRRIFAAGQTTSSRARYARTSLRPTNQWLAQLMTKEEDSPPSKDLQQRSTINLP